MSIRFNCPECHASIKVSERHAGQKGRCSTCNAKILVPTLEQAAEMEAKAARKKALKPPSVTWREKPAAPREKEKAKPPPAAVAATEPDLVSQPPSEFLPDPVAQQPQAPPPAAPTPAEKVAEPAGDQLDFPDDFFDNEPVETPDLGRPIKAPASTTDEVIEEMPAAAEVFEEPFEAVEESEAEAIEPEKVEVAEEEYDDRELVTAPAASLSSAEGNDILSAMSLNPRELIHLEHDDDDHHAPIMKKSVGLEGVEELVDMTAMVDIVFFLLIFFMMTTMQNVSASIETPAPDPDKLATQGRAVASMDDDSNAVKIRIEADNSIQFDGERVAGEQDLKSRLSAAFPGGGGSKKLFVIGHGDAFHGTVVMVLDAAHSNGIQDIRLAVADEEP